MNREQSTSLTREQVTLLLQAWSEGDVSAPEKLAPLIYSELQRLAKRSMRREYAQQTLETGALINEAYLRLADWKNARWENRGHFYGVASQIMRRVLVDYARAAIKSVATAFDLCRWTMPWSHLRRQRRTCSP